MARTISPLLQFFRARYRPDKCSTTTDNWKHYRTAIGRLETCLGRGATLDDLNEETLRTLLASLDGLRDDRARRETIYLLRAIWKHASHCGLTVGPKPPSKALQMKARRLAAGANPIPREKITTLREFFWHMYLPLRLAGRSDNALRLHDVTLNNFARYLGREAVFADLTSETVSRFILWIRERGREAITANDNRNRIMALARFAARKRFIEEEPDTVPLPETKRVPKGWLAHEIEKLWQALGEVRGEVAGVPAAIWWKSLHLVIWFTGERIGAVLQLRWADLDFETAWLNVPGHIRKGQCEDKLSRLKPVVLESLAMMREPRRDRIFQWDRCTETLYHHYKKILIEAGLPYDRRSMFHRMRKSAASHFEAKGGNATALLGHGSRRVTMKYLDPRIVTQVQGADLLFTPGEETGGAA
jgi:integrase